MTPDGVDERLPRSVGGLIDFAFVSYAARAPLFIALALGAFGAQMLVEFAMPNYSLDDPRILIKLQTIQYTSIFADAYVIAAVALGVASRLRDDGKAARVGGAAAERWLPLVAIGLLVQAVADVTIPLSAIGRLPDPPALAVVTAPLVWLLWGSLALAAPIAAVGGKRPALAVFDGLWHAVALSLHPANVRRLIVLAFASIVPWLLYAIAYDVMSHHAVARTAFWSSAPIDAITVGPLAALQTAFALDFARRAQRAA